MPQRAFILILFLYGLPCFAQFNFKNGEVLLRGTYIKDSSGAHLVLNKETRSMRVIDIKTPDKSISLDNYVSGLKVETCIELISSQGLPNMKGLVQKIRPLAPKEPMIFYSGDINGCSTSKGCRGYAKPIKASPLGNVMLTDLPKDYLQCE